jgi:hypothetical protein
LSDDNPFERFGLDPLLGPRGITERMRELVEEAPEAERAAIRSAWEELTLHPARRVRAALLAHPETRPPLPPRPFAARAPPGASEPELTLDDLALRPSVALALGAAADAAPDLPPAGPRAAPSARALPSSGSASLEDDPVLALLCRDRGGDNPPSS